MLKALLLPPGGSAVNDVYKAVWWPAGKKDATDLLARYAESVSLKEAQKVVDSALWEWPQRESLRKMAGEWELPEFAY